MTNAVTTTSGGKPLPALPSYITGAKDANALIKAGVGSGFQMPPQITPRGGKIRVKIDGEEKIIEREVEGELVPASFINVVIVSANAGKYKLYYKGKYNEDSEGEAPVCYSYDGERPSQFAQEPQCKTCAACPHNVFGSMITEQGNKTRACSDNKILAVIPYTAVKQQADPDSIAGTAFMLKVSPTGLSRNKKDRKDNPTNNTSLAEYVALLDNYPANGQTVSVPIQAAVTRVFLDKQTDYPLFRYRLAGFLTPDEIAYVKAREKGEDILAIVTDQGKVSVEGADEFEQPARANGAAAAPKQPQAATVDEDDDGETTRALSREEKRAVQEATAAAARDRDPDDDEDEAPAPPPPRARGKGGRPSNAARAAAAAPPADTKVAANTPAEPAKTSSRMDEELKSIASLF